MQAIDAEPPWVNAPVTSRSKARPPGCAPQRDGGEPPRVAAWSGAAFFTVSKARISDVWILGDLDGLTRTLDANAQASARVQRNLWRQ